MPPLATSSSCVPFSTMLPSCTTAIWSADITVERRCAMRTTVHWSPSMSVSMDSCTMPSFSASRAEVASSRNSSFGFRRKHRAIARRCRWPPERSIPFSPMRVSYSSSIFMMNSWAFARLHASTMSSCGGFWWGLSKRPYVRLSSTEEAKSCVSWDTKPQHFRTLFDDSSAMSLPSRSMRPSVGS
mmetsp:Transcript_54664/g.153805  ORF Transcript_54664/g.153805 Transcript_54664/m.153805 type:complete len:185 (+) Transcript_54664:358-912(+)